MKPRCLEAKHWLLLFLLALLGTSVSSCEKYGCPECDQHALMYGVPTTEYNDSIVDKP